MCIIIETSSEVVLQRRTKDTEFATTIITHWSNQTKRNGSMRIRNTEWKKKEEGQIENAYLICWQFYWVCQLLMSASHLASGSLVSFCFVDGAFTTAHSTIFYVVWVNKSLEIYHRIPMYPSSIDNMYI